MKITEKLKHQNEYPNSINENQFVLLAKYLKKKY